MEKIIKRKVENMPIYIYRERERVNQPLWLQPDIYRVDNGKVITQMLEVNVVNHCNLSCRGCSHSAPTIKKSSYDKDVLNNDLKLLSSFFKCDHVRILGGEPLLNPNLHNLIETVKESKISDKIFLVTNGILLPKLPKETAELIDEIRVSLYSCKQTEKVKEYTDNFKTDFENIKIKVSPVNNFRESISKEPTKDKKLTQIIYDTCQIAHIWRNITLDNGYLFRCPQQVRYAEIHNDYTDALSLKDIKSANDILDFLESNNPIKSCSSCLGWVGNEFKHQQIKGRDFEKYLPNKPEDAINWDFVKQQKEKFNKTKHNIIYTQKSNKFIFKTIRKIKSLLP